MIQRFVIAITVASPMVLSAVDARADECGTVKQCAEQMVALANEIKGEHAELLRRIEELEALKPKWNESAGDLVALKKALSEPLPAREVDVPPKQLGKCQTGEVMVGWKYYRTPDLEDFYSKVYCAKVFGERP
ncbi:hypothetical protein [Mesorhizobium sp.]|uniref:hypothetical protein n=1 Tax=Mesorhizobium sp. TaxID=1871066 RepID=UPI000FE8E50D|nr:hypothetical protein [Mesorhizobium sp.]RWB65417.1 MAG: hypothetical protein EOQ49_32175 [Mesorhizobium sp.]